MINVKSTIFNTLKLAFDRMRLLGDNDTQLLKKIMFLIVLDDIYDWSDYLDENQSIQKRLQELRTNFILCNPEFDVCRFPFNQSYINVNTPQTNNTWKRVWDSEHTVFVDYAEKIIPTDDPKPWTPDPSCAISTVYFGGEDDPIKANADGTPLVNVNDLTVCEKMNIYINRETGTMYYLTPDCVWKAVSGQGVDEEEVIKLIKQHRGKINRTWKQDSIELEIVDESDSDADPEIELLTEDDLEDIV